MDYFLYDRQITITIKEIIRFFDGKMEVTLLNSDSVEIPFTKKSRYVNLNGFELIFGGTQEGFGSLKVDYSQYNEKLETQSYIISTKTEGEFSGGNTIEDGIKNGQIKTGTKLIITSKVQPKGMDVIFEYDFKE